MTQPANLNCRQTIEGMPLVFDADAAGDLAAAIQFDVSGHEPGIYHLYIVDSECTFHGGPTDSPALTISTSSDVWLKISRGELSGQEALMQGLYSAEGDLSLLLRLDVLFKTGQGVIIKAPPGQRPGGPIPLSGMTWMTVAFIPWMIHWIVFDIPGVSPWLSVGLPLLLSVLIVGYRLVFDRPVWMEVGGLGYFVLASVLTLGGNVVFATWGSIIGSLVMAGLWLSSLLLAKLPLSGDYSKWAYTRALWRNSMFIYPNAIISLMWGWQFIAAASIGAAALLLPDLYAVLTIVRYSLLVPAFVFTTVYQKRAPEHRVDNYEQAMDRLRFWAGVGLSVVLVMMLAAAALNFDVRLFG